jgi:hypothetical protein
MESNNSKLENSIVNQLSFGAKTAKRVTWEAWEFTVVGQAKVQVTNASYGFLKDEHSYVVDVEENGGQPLPAACECPADEYREDYDCKHKVALATVGGSTVLNAAMEVDPAKLEQDSVANKPLADGGCDCDGDDFPCFECYLSGRRNFVG